MLFQRSLRFQCVGSVRRKGRAEAAERATQEAEVCLESHRDSYHPLHFGYWDCSSDIASVTETLAGGKMAVISWDKKLLNLLNLFTAGRKNK